MAAHGQGVGPFVEGYGDCCAQESGYVVLYADCNALEDSMKVYGNGQYEGLI